MTDLRPHQQEAVDRLKAKGGRTILEVPTGAGKTATMTVLESIQCRNCRFWQQPQAVGPRQFGLCTGKGDEGMFFKTQPEDAELWTASTYGCLEHVGKRDADGT